MKNINNDPKNNFNSENERGFFLNFFGEILIFFGSILKLIWINENKPNKRKNQKIEKTWTTWSPSLIEVADQVVLSAHPFILGDGMYIPSNPLNPMILTWQSQINLDQSPTTNKKLN